LSALCPAPARSARPAYEEDEGEEDEDGDDHHEEQAGKEEAVTDAMIAEDDQYWEGVLFDKL